MSPNTTYRSTDNGDEKSRLNKSEDASRWGNGRRSATAGRRMSHHPEMPMSVRESAVTWNLTHLIMEVLLK
jgi:hypothetical protein